LLGVVVGDGYLMQRMRYEMISPRPIALSERCGDNIRAPIPDIA